MKSTRRKEFWSKGLKAPLDYRNLHTLFTIPSHNLHTSLPSYTRFVRYIREKENQNKTEEKEKKKNTKSI